MTLTPEQLSLLTQIIVRSSEYCYIRRPISNNVTLMLDCGYLRAVNHNGAAVLQATEAGKLAVVRNALE